jgi:GDP-D-mannose 3', 5'-epimerase
MKKAIVFGAGGFIGGHMVKRLLDEGYKVLALDIKSKEEWYQVHNESFNNFKFDLRDNEYVSRTIKVAQADELYQFAADMGGAGYIFSGDNDADVMHNSATINLITAEAVAKHSLKTKVFYSSSACIYPGENQTDPNNPNCREDSAYPANPDSEYGWEKLFSERLWLAYRRNYKVDVRIARFHNIFGPYGTWKDGKEKAPAAMCRKAIEANDSFEVWGPGTQTRSFLYVDECIDGVRRLMQSDVKDIINIGSEEMISINNLALMALDIAGKKTNVKISNVPGPIGVAGRNSDNRLIHKLLKWKPSMPLRDGMEKTFAWIQQEVDKISASLI